MGKHLILFLSWNQNEKNALKRMNDVGNVNLVVLPFNIICEGTYWMYVIIPQKVS